MTLKHFNMKLSMRNLIMVFSFLLPICLFGQKIVKAETKNETSVINLSFEEYCLKNAISYLNIPEQKQSSVNIAGELKFIDSKDNVSYKDYAIELKENETQYFKLIGSDKTLVVQSLFVLRLNYANSKK